MKHRILWIVAAVALALVAADRARETKLQQAIDLMGTKGDVAGAIKLLEDVARSSDRNLAARGLLYLGDCREKLGQKESRASYERILRDFRDQQEVAAEASRRLAALGGPAKSAEPAIRVIPTADGAFLLTPSRDGRYILEREEDGALAAVDARTRQARRVAGGPVGTGRFSNDGRQIAFVRFVKNTSDVWISEVWTVGADGTGERLLFRPDKGHAGAIGWSADNQRVLVEAGQEKGPCRFLFVPVNGGSPSTLIEKPDGCFYAEDVSPDTRYLLRNKHVRDDPPQDEIWLVSLEDRSERLLYQPQSTVGSIRWSPDGNGILFLSDRRMPGVSMDLWLLHVAGGKPQGVPEMVRKDLGSMNGKTSNVYAIGPITRDGALYFRRTQGTSDMRQLLTTTFDPGTGKAVGNPSFVSRRGGTSNSPTFSRDGKWLTYISDGKRVMMQSTESGEERVIGNANDPATFTWAVLFPDGRSLLMCVLPGNNQGTPIYRMDAATGQMSSLKKAGEEEVRGWPNAISPDGRTIYFNRYAPGFTSSCVTARDIETGKERKISCGLGSRGFSLSPDGKQMASTHPDGEDLVIDVIPEAGGPAREVHRVQGFDTSDIAWTPDGRFLIFAPSKVPANGKAYFRIPATGGKAEPIGISASADEHVRFPRAVGGLRFNPNGRQVAYTARDDIERQEDWVLENFLPGLKTSK